MTSIYKDRCFFLSCDLPLDVKVYVDHLHIAGLPPHVEEQAEDLIVSVRLVDGGIPLCSGFKATRVPHRQGSFVHWNEWLVLPVKICDLPKTAQLVVELWGVGLVLLGGSTIRVFDSRLRLKRGMQKLAIWPLLNRGDASTPEAQLGMALGTVLGDAQMELVRSDRKLHLLKLMEQYELAETPQTPWIERLAFAQLRKDLGAAQQARGSGVAGRHRRRCPSADAVLARKVGGAASGDASGRAPRSAAGEDARAVADDVAASGSCMEATAPVDLYLHLPAFDVPVIYEDWYYAGASVPPPPVPPAVMKWPHPGLLAAELQPPIPVPLAMSSAVLAGAQPSPLTLLSTGGGLPAGLAAPPGLASSVGAGGVSGAASQAAGAAASGALAAAIPFWNEGETLTLIHDPEAELPNPVEAKYMRLARSQMRNMVDTNLKPSRGELSRIQAAVAAPTLDVRLASDVKDLLWKFRYSLTANKKALSKFLLSVDWEDEEDVREAVSLLPKWAPIDTEDALRLLSYDFCRARAVREHAVNALKRAADEDLVMYLPQLVQALRYEPDLIDGAAAGTGDATAGAAAAGPAGGAAPGRGSAAGKPTSPPGTARRDGGAGVSGAAATGVLSPSAVDAYAAPGGYVLSPLADFLIDRACECLELGNFLFWYLIVEIEDARLGGLFSQVHAAFVARLDATPSGRAIAEIMALQGSFLFKLSTAVKEVTASKASVAAKIDKLNTVLAPGGAYAELCAIEEPIRMPLNPSLLISGVVPKGCRIFKSALYPTVVTLAVDPASTLDWTRPPPTAGLKIHPSAAEAARAARERLAAVSLRDRDFPDGSGTSAAGTRGGAVSPATTAGVGRSPASVGVGLPASIASSPAGGLHATVASAVAAAMPLGTPPASYKVIFKNGDDMRQDQLIIQMIRLMDQQLKRVGLDLRLTPYRVLATSTSTGMMEMVLDSEPVSAVMSTYRSDIMAFFRAHHPREGAEYGIDPDTMDTYVKSAAGYCVITYLLGIGDRHLDNIMLRKDGHLFHLDFGYIFGRDPKPLPPPMRLTKEMIDGMGGPESNNYNRFKGYCCQAYNILRKSANLVLCLLNLMRDAGIEALAEAPDLVIAKLQEKFRLDIDDEAADQVFLKLVDESVAAMFPAFFEVVHKIRVAMR